MRKPATIVYGVDDRPPIGITALSGAQHLGLMSINLIYPVLITREAGVSPETAIQVVSISMLVLALGAILQAMKRGPIGSGFLCQPVPTAAYLLPSLLAAREGGLALVFGMTIAAGLFEVVLARGIRHLRPWFPPEIAGLVILMIGMATAAVGMRTLLGIGAPEQLDATHVEVAAVTLGTMVALNVWTKGALRLFCVLIGMTAGYLAMALLGGFSPADVAKFDTAPTLALPKFEHAGWSFSWGLAVPFAVAALAAAFKCTGNIISCQKLNDADWLRPDMQSISRGVLADGMATVSAGAIGTTGVSSSTMNVGLANATGVLSRHVAYAVAGILVLLAFFPKLGSVFYHMPPAVAGSMLLFAASFIIVNGFEIITSRLLDARKTFMVGLSFIGALAVDFYPVAFRGLPASIEPLVSSSIVLGTLCALVLNLLFRLGIRTTRSLVVEPDKVDAVAIEGFMEAQGAAWGARRDIIERAKFNLAQSLEVILDSCEPQGQVEVRASFDEFNLDIRVSYVGPPIELPEKRPTIEEIMESEEGQRHLAGFMLRRFADRVSSMHKGGRSTIHFHFDH